MVNKGEYKNEQLKTHGKLPTDTDCGETPTIKAQCDRLQE